MKPLTREWVEKAEGDFAPASRELRARKSPNSNAACFHAQQCIENYLKACLQEADIAFGRTRNLVALLDFLRPLELAWEFLRPHLRALIAFAVAFRYPGESADKEDAREGLTLCRTVRRRIRHDLGIDP